MSSFKLPRIFTECHKFNVYIYQVKFFRYLPSVNFGIFQYLYNSMTFHNLDIIGKNFLNVFNLK